MGEGNAGKAPWAYLRTVRVRLLVIALLPILILLPLLLFTAVKSWSNRFDALLTAKVAGELTIADQYLKGLLQSRGAMVAALGQSARLAHLASNPAARDAWLDQQRAALGLDFLFMVPGGAPTKWPVERAALAGKENVAIDVFGASDLDLLAPGLAARARLSLVPTEAAVPTERVEEARGMIVHAAAPAPGGALVGGQLLNRNLAFIDEMNAIVYPDFSRKGGTIGTTTLFLEDVRISTNVRLFEDVRALGTRVSAAVRGRVLDEGRTWLGRAFVVNDWYVSGYEPLIDSFGERVGMLYVGFLEAPFVQAERQITMQIAMMFALVVMLSVPLLLRWAQGIFAPLERMTAAISRVEKGDLGARTGGSARADEIGRVAKHLDTLLDQLQERDRRLREWAEELERRVANRTSDLEEANRQLEATTRQLVLSEKLATIGEITAGVAHEINNPLAVIQGNLDVVREDLGRRAHPLKTEFSLIQDQIHAIHILVSKLLRFARPEEYAGNGSGVSPDAVIRDTLPLVSHALTRAQIKVHLDLAAGGIVSMNQTELQQVLINLMVNAIQAMPSDGQLSIATRLLRREGDEKVEIVVADTGVGIPVAVLPRIFDPFFTTKRAEGTGLGLSISATLIDRAGGTITATSTEGEGTRFTIVLPVSFSDRVASTRGSGS